MLNDPSKPTHLWRVGKLAPAASIQSLTKTLILITYLPKKAGDHRSTCMFARGYRNDWGPAIVHRRSRVHWRPWRRCFFQRSVCWSLILSDYGSALPSKIKSSLSAYLLRALASNARIFPGVKQKSISHGCCSYHGHVGRCWLHEQF